jgi:hypothetical protein
MLISLSGWKKHKTTKEPQAENNVEEAKQIQGELLQQFHSEFKDLASQFKAVLLVSYLRGIEIRGYQESFSCFNSDLVKGSAT